MRCGSFLFSAIIQSSLNLPLTHIDKPIKRISRHITQTFRMYNKSYPKSTKKILPRQYEDSPK